MFAINPFAALSSFIPPGVMQTYVVIMIFLVAAGTLFDIVHKGSAKYFFTNWRTNNKKAREVSGGELVRFGVKTAGVEVFARGGFGNMSGRIGLLLTCSGFSWPTAEWT